MEFRFCKFEDKNLIIIQHEEFANDKEQSVKFLNDEMNK